MRGRALRLWEIRVTMKRVADADSNLYERGFNWIQGMPVNQ
jgi:hypothetical protein